MTVISRLFSCGAPPSQHKTRSIMALMVSSKVANGRPCKPSRYQFESFLRPLIIISGVFALPVPSSKTLHSKLWKFYRLYVLMIIVVLACSLVWSLKRKMQLYSSAIRYLEVILISSLVLTNLLSIACTVFIRRKSLCKFVKLLKKVDANLNVENEVSPRDYHLLVLQLLLLHMFVFFYGAYESWSLITVFGFDAYKSHLIFYLNIYMVALTVMKVYHFSMALKYRFALLNKKLLLCKKGILAEVYVIKRNSNLRFFRKNHLLLSDAVMLMGDAFGAQILCITMIIIIFIIQAFNMAVNYGKIANGDGEVAFKMILMCVWNTGMFLVFAIMMAASCEQTIKEKNRTQTICHKLLIQLPLNEQQEATRREFRLLAQQIEQREVRFSAVGFFTIDHTLLLTIFGSIASYVIIIIQFF